MGGTLRKVWTQIKEKKKDRESQWRGTGGERKTKGDRPRKGEINVNVGTRREAGWRDRLSSSRRRENSSG